MSFAIKRFPTNLIAKILFTFFHIFFRVCWQGKGKMITYWLLGEVDNNGVLKTVTVPPKLGFAKPQISIIKDEAKDVNVKQQWEMEDVMQRMQRNSSDKCFLCCALHIISAVFVFDAVLHSINSFFAVHHLVMNLLSLDCRIFSSLSLFMNEHMNAYRCNIKLNIKRSLHFLSLFIFTRLFLNSTNKPNKNKN